MSQRLAFNVLTSFFDPVTHKIAHKAPNPAKTSKRLYRRARKTKANFMGKKNYFRFIEIKIYVLR